MIPDASKLELTPVDAHQLHEHGLVITYEKICSLRDEKKELQRRILQEGEDISVEYRIDGIKAEIVYNVSCLEPCHARVGAGTVVIIKGESLDARRRVGSARLSSLFGLDTGLTIGLKKGEKEEPQEYHFNIQPFKKPPIEKSPVPPYISRGPLIDVMHEEDGYRVIVTPPVDYKLHGDILELFTGDVHPFEIFLNGITNPVVQPSYHNNLLELYVRNYTG